MQQTEDFEGIKVSPHHSVHTDGQWLYDGVQVGHHHTSMNPHFLFEATDAYLNPRTFDIQGREGAVTRNIAADGVDGTITVWFDRPTYHVSFDAMAQQPEQTTTPVECTGVDLITYPYAFFGYSGYSVQLDQTWRHVDITTEFPVWGISVYDGFFGKLGPRIDNLSIDIPDAPLAGASLGWLLLLLGFLRARRRL